MTRTLLALALVLSTLGAWELGGRFESTVPFGDLETYAGGGAGFGISVLHQRGRLRFGADLFGAGLAGKPVGYDVGFARAGLGLGWRFVQRPGWAMDVTAWGDGYRFDRRYFTGTEAGYSAGYRVELGWQQLLGRTSFRVAASGSVLGSLRPTAVLLGLGLGVGHAF